MRTALLVLALALLCACKTQKPLPVDSLPPHAVLLALDSLQRHQLTPEKTFLSRLFGGGGKVKLKGVVLNVNTQTASNGSTIGANAQSGNDESKVKGSAVSTATAANTGGQGATVTGNPESSATNTTKKKNFGGVLMEYGIWIAGLGILLYYGYRRFMLV